MTDAMKKLVGLLADTRKSLDESGGDAGSAAGLAEVVRSALERLERSLKRPPRVLVAGEANSGKTSVANMLAGLDVLPAAVIANTAVPVLLRHGVVPSVMALTETGRLPVSTTATADALPNFLYKGLQRIEVELPGMSAGRFEILDTPAWPPKDDLTRVADILLWCSVAIRPWTESERRAVAAMPARLRRRGVLAVTHRDALSPEDLDKVRARYDELAGPLFSGIVLVDAATRPYGSNAADEPAGVRIGDGDQKELRREIDARVAEYWAHRAIVGRRICRHVARLFRPHVPELRMNGAARSGEDRLYGVLHNIAGRLASA